MSYHPALGQPASPPEADAGDPDTAPGFNPLAPLTTSRGFVQVPTYDVRQYVQSTLLTLAIGFGAGVTVGAIFGNILGERKLPGVSRLVGANPRRRRRRRTSRNPGKRRTSVRRRKRGRPTATMVSETLVVTLDGRPMEVVVERGAVFVDGRKRGSVYDLGTSFRGVPSGGGEVRDFGTMAGAVKHVIRRSKAA